MPKAADARFARGACLVAMLVMAGASLADTRALYRWTDAQGRVQYSDKPPTGFKGEVTRVDIELDTKASAAAAPVPRENREPVVAPDVLRDVIAPPADANKVRRDSREKHEVLVRQAEEKVAAAKAAIENGEAPQDGEGQVVQRLFAQPQAGRSNCRAVTEGGKTVFNCPSLVPNQEYYERIRVLEEALRKAEEELAAARTAYRRAVD